MPLRNGLASQTQPQRGHPKIALLICLAAAALAAKPIITLENGHRYDLGKSLGSGVDGKVYQAIDLTTQKTVAIKMIKDIESYQEEVAAPFEALNHNSIGSFAIEVLDHGLIPAHGTEQDTGLGAGAIVMRESDGTLEHFRKEFQVGEPQGIPLANLSEQGFQERAQRVQSLVYQSLQLWGALMETGLIYNDIKPTNIGYEKSSSRIVLLDLGSLVNGPLTSQSKQRIYRTRGFSAPESTLYLQRMLPRGEVYSAYADLFSLGKTVTNMICGECMAQDIPGLITAWRKQIRDTPENQRALAALIFANDFVTASLKDAPESGLPR